METLTHTDLEDLTPLEVRGRLLDVIEETLAPLQIGPGLPFDRIAVHLLAQDATQRFRLKAAVEELAPDFDTAVRGRLKEAGLALPPRFVVRHEWHEAAPERLQTAFQRHGILYVEPEEQTTACRATLRIAQGHAEQETYEIESGKRYNVGRLRQVADAPGRIVRRNDIVFLDPEDASLSADDAAVNETVSREHATLTFDEASGCFLWHNQQGTTSLIRPGYARPMRVGRQPLPLEDGDELYVGRALVVFTLKNE